MGQAGGKHQDCRCLVIESKIDACFDIPVKCEIQGQIGQVGKLDIHHNGFS
jgi:hypothetical protein